MLTVTIILPSPWTWPSPYLDSENDPDPDYIHLPLCHTDTNSDSDPHPDSPSKQWPYIAALSLIFILTLFLKLNSTLPQILTLMWPPLCSWFPQWTPRVTLISTRPQHPDTALQHTRLHLTLISTFTLTINLALTMTLSWPRHAFWPWFWAHLVTRSSHSP